MAPWMSDRHRGGREEQMRVQDSVLSASAVLWDIERPSASAGMRTDAPSLTNIADLSAASTSCSRSLQRLQAVACRQTRRCS